LNWWIISISTIWRDHQQNSTFAFDTPNCLHTTRMDIQLILWLNPWQQSHSPTYSVMLGSVLITSPKSLSNNHSTKCSYLMISYSMNNTRNVYPIYNFILLVYLIAMAVKSISVPAVTVEGIYLPPGHIHTWKYKTKNVVMTY
jgi:hypothetical protein